MSDVLQTLKIKGYFFACIHNNVSRVERIHLEKPDGVKNNDIRCKPFLADFVNGLGDKFPTKNIIHIVLSKNSK